MYKMDILQKLIIKDTRSVDKFIKELRLLSVELKIVNINDNTHYYAIDLNKTSINPSNLLLFLDLIGKVKKFRLEKIADKYVLSIKEF